MYANVAGNTRSAKGKTTFVSQKKKKVSNGGRRRLKMLPAGLFSSTISRMALRICGGFELNEEDLWEDVEED